MRIHDISMPLTTGMAVWPGDPPLERSLWASMGPESAANVSQLRMSVHSGTHVDAPIHFVPGGAAAESLALDVLVGPCLVCAVETAGTEISVADLEQVQVPAGTQRLLLKTRNSQRRLARRPIFQPDFVALSAEAARWVVARGVLLVGIDCLSVEPFGHSEPVVHCTLLEAGVVPLEGLELSMVAPGHYTLVCLPLMLPGSDGAPARAILIEES